MGGMRGECGEGQLSPAAKQNFVHHESCLFYARISGPLVI